MTEDRIKALEAALTEWWVGTAEDEVGAVAPKAIEYGSRDLVEMGRTLARVAGREVTDEEATELGVWFYVLGKMARWTAAVERGERVSDDTLHDLAVYVKMAQRTRATGSWPGVDLDEWEERKAQILKPALRAVREPEPRSSEFREGGVIRPLRTETDGPYAPFGNDVEDECAEPDHTPGNACPVADHQQERVTLKSYTPESHQWAPTGEKAWGAEEVRRAREDAEFPPVGTIRGDQVYLGRRGHRGTCDLKCDVIGDHQHCWRWATELDRSIRNGGDFDMQDTTPSDHIHGNED